MKKISLLLLGLCISCSLTHAQNIVGSWGGNLTFAGQSLPVIFHITDSSGALKATMDSPLQGAKGIPVKKITQDSGHIKINLGMGDIVYTAHFVTADSIAGTFAQHGLRLPLSLKKGFKWNTTVPRPQRPKPPFPYNIDYVTFKNKKANIILAGTLTFPKKGHRFPAVVLISGSGPQDRDETILDHKPFWVIADYLTRHGIAVLRFDDRGTAQSEGVFATATTADLATDAEAAVQYLKTRPEINPHKIGLIGHSEGGIEAPMIASRDKSIDFIVLLAGPGVDGADLLVMQNEALGKAAGMSVKQLESSKKLNRALYQITLQHPNDSVAQQLIIQKMRTVSQDTAFADAAQKRFIASAKALTTPWMRYFLKNNPADYLKKVSCPVLALDGTKDLQVPAERNIAAIKKALQEGGNTQVTTKIFPNLNHLFQTAKTGLPSEYAQIPQTFAPVALQFMTNWILKQVR